MSYDELRGYLRRLKRLSESREVTIDWDVVKTSQVYPFPMQKRMGLQVADSIASGIFKALEQDRNGFIEDRYVRMLSRVFYRGAARRLSGYGLKIYPGEAEKSLRENDLRRWFSELCEEK